MLASNSPPHLHNLGRRGEVVTQWIRNPTIARVRFPPATPAYSPM